MDRLTILIVDDHPIILAGLRLLLDAYPQFAICGEATTASVARESAQRLAPDLIVADLMLGGEDGIGMIETLVAAAPGSRVLVYSSRDELIYARHALRVGAHGFVSKGDGLNKVAEALVTLARGETHFGKTVQQSIIANDVAQSVSYAAILSPRELETLDLMGSGHTLASLAQALGVTVKTAGTYRERLKRKLGLDSVRMLDRFAVEHASGKSGIE